MLNKLFVALQHLLPARTLGRIVYVLARSEKAWIARPLIVSFIKLFDVELAEAEGSKASSYKSFNEFFTRRLKPGARPFSAGTDELGCPADGYVQHCGLISAGELIQAKGMKYSAQELTGDTNDGIEAFRDGSYLTIYLAPHNYHRVHMPVDGSIEQARFIPGELFSVNKATTQALPGLFVRNERLACRGRSAAGDFWIVFVGAMNVASISTAWAGEIFPDRTAELPSVTRYAKGDYIGHFNLGSTVVLLFPENTVEWSRDLVPDRPLQVGETIGRLLGRQ